MIRLIVAKTDGLDVEKAKGLPLLTPEDIALADKNINSEEKVFRLVSEFFKRKYVKEWTKNENGKLISKDICFSLAHSNNCVTLVLSDLDVGVDVERIRHVNARLKAYLSNPEEYKIETDEDFFKVWTSKESLVKAVGLGSDYSPVDIPAIPFCGVKVFKDKPYYSAQTIAYDCVISVTRLSTEPFDLDIEEEDFAAE